MSHSLRCRLKDLRYKKIITGRECERLCKALDTEKAIEDIRAEIEQLPSDMGEAIDLRTGQIATKYISSQKVLQIIDKHTKEHTE